MRVEKEVAVAGFARVTDEVVEVVPSPVWKLVMNWTPS